MNKDLGVGIRIALNWNEAAWSFRDNDLGNGKVLDAFQKKLPPKFLAKGRTKQSFRYDVLERIILAPHAVDLNLFVSGSLTGPEFFYRRETAEYLIGFIRASVPASCTQPRGDSSFSERARMARLSFHPHIHIRIDFQPVLRGFTNIICPRISPSVTKHNHITNYLQKFARRTLHCYVRGTIRLITETPSGNSPFFFFFPGMKRVPVLRLPHRNSGKYSQAA